MINCPGCASRLIGNPQICTACRHILRPATEDERISQVFALVWAGVILAPLPLGYFSETMMANLLMLGGSVTLAAFLYKMALGPDRFKQWHPNVWEKLLNAASSLEYFYSCAWIPAGVIDFGRSVLRGSGQLVLLIFKIGAGLVAAYFSWALLSKFANTTGWPGAMFLVWFAFYQWQLHSRVSEIEKRLESLPRMNARTDD